MNPGCCNAALSVTLLTAIPAHFSDKGESFFMSLELKQRDRTPVSL
jgi:hypothetical protein